MKKTIKAIRTMRWMVTILAVILIVVSLFGGAFGLSWCLPSEEEKQEIFETCVSNNETLPLSQGENLYFSAQTGTVYTRTDNGMAKERRREYYYMPTGKVLTENERVAAVEAHTNLYTSDLACDITFWSFLVGLLAIVILLYFEVNLKTKK